MKNKLKDFERELKEISQHHVLNFLNDLTSEQISFLLEQIEKFDFVNIPEWVEKYILKDDLLNLPKLFDPAPFYPSEPKTAEQTERYANACQIGENLICQGKVAGFVVAGGQGTRLGFDGPKGNYPISPIRKKTLFQLFAEYLLAASEKYNTVIPWYIMTSPLNYNATVEIFENMDYYGLAKDNIFIFQQGTLPNFDFSGKILLADKNQIATSPDGHGGSLKAILKSGALADMKKRGIEYLSYWQVDSPMIHLIDPLFIGLNVIDSAEMSSKALLKTDPLEKVGNFCKVNDKITVIEYSDLPEEAAYQTNTDGSLTFKLGSIGIHMISIDFIEKLNADGNFALPFHRAVKKIPYIDQNGQHVEPVEPNGIKLETFVFDAIPMAYNSIILETCRQEEFAPVKNASGVDSAKVTSQMMIDRVAAWHELAGVHVPRKADGSPDCVLELAASFALSAKDIKAKVNYVPVLTPDCEVYLE